MKKLIIINGTMGVGKTTVCKELYQCLESSVWLDGDWCWLMNPWNFSKENKQMVLDNIQYLLRNYLKNSSFTYIVFCWVIHQEQIFELILDPLQDLEFELYKITLLCSEQALQQRMIQDNREISGIQHSIDRLKLYNDMNTYKIDTTTLTVPATVEEILALLSTN